LVDHLWDDPSEERTDQFKTGIRVDLNEPGLKVPVYHEVQSENFEVMAVSFGRDLDESTFDCIHTDLLHSSQNVFFEVVLFLGTVGVEVFLELQVGDFVGRLVLAVVGRVLLDGVICEVYFPLEVMDIKLVRGSANVAFLEPVGLQNAVNLADHHVVPYVELPLLVKKGPIDVELHDEGFFAAVLMPFL
jgi:hypothetical protein